MQNTEYNTLELRRKARLTMLYKLSHDLIGVDK